MKLDTACMEEIKRMEAKLREQGQLQEGEKATLFGILRLTNDMVACMTYRHTNGS